jgi:uncharacterized membrane protein
MMGTMWGRTLLVAALLAVAGFAVATYLTVVHYGDQPIACNGIGDCDYVNSSEYASLAGVPVALLGAGAYAAILAASVTAWRSRGPLFLYVAWSVAMASWAFSAYLTYIELYVLDAICVYCVVSAVLMTGLAVLLSLAVWGTQLDEPDEAAPGSDAVRRRAQEPSR